MRISINEKESNVVSVVKKINLISLLCSSNNKGALMHFAINRFIRRLFVFLLPLIAIYISICAYALFYPSIFKTKADYIKEHKKEIEVLFLGSSHTQYAINPRLIEADGRVMNLAYGGQTIKLNKMLLDKFSPEMKSLKYLMIELDYFSLEHSTGNEEYRQPLYQTFYGIAGGDGDWWTRYFFTKEDLMFFAQSAALNVWNYFKNPDYAVNEWGFIENNVNYQFARMNYDEDEICRTLPHRLQGSHPHESVENFETNAAFVDSLLQFCADNDIRPIFIGYPVYKSYYYFERPVKQARRLHYIKQAMKHYPNLLFWDFEQDSRFAVHDFWDDDHLDVSGANKLSEIINEKLKETNTSPD